MLDRWIMRSWHLTILLIAVCILTSVSIVSSTQAKTTALLIGVSDYDETIGLADLRGPVNDVKLMRDALQSRGVTDIRILADGIDGSARPTREAIMDALANLTKEATDGDLFIIHMSGHGTRQPDDNNDEADGYDELFLPADVTRAEPGSRQIPNAIVDEELGDVIDLIRKTGADVWFIMDACHSGTGLRAGGLNTADRYIDPSVLGISGVTSVNAGKNDDKLIADSPKSDNLQGNLIAFYSAQADELAREVDFSSADGSSTASANPDQNNWFGLFTAKLANRILSAGSISYRQLFQGVMADMNSTNVPGAARLQTPHWEGDLIDAVVLGGSDTVDVRQYQVDFDMLSAGTVHGIEIGTIVELVSDAAASSDEIIGYAQVEDVTPLSSFLRPVTDTCVPKPEPLCEVSGELNEKAQFARVTVVPVSSTIVLSPVLDRSENHDEAKVSALSDTHPLSVKLQDAINVINSETTSRFKIDKSEYDVEVSLHADKLWFGQVTMAKGVPVGLSWEIEGDDTIPLESILQRIAYAQRFSGIFSSIAESASLLNPSPIEVRSNWRSSEVKLLSPVGAEINPVRECRNIMRRDAFASQSQLPPRAKLKQCDILQFSARGMLSGVRDVNRIHIDSKFCVRAQYTRIEDNRTKLSLGDDMIMCSDCPDGYSAGHEQLFVLVSEARANQEPLNLEGVVDNCSTRSGTRGLAKNTINKFLKSLGKQPGTRGAMGGFATENVWVERLDWQVVPRVSVLQ